MFTWKKKGTEAQRYLDIELKARPTFKEVLMMSKNINKFGYENVIFCKQAQTSLYQVYNPWEEQCIGVSDLSGLTKEGYVLVDQFLRLYCFAKCDVAILFKEEDKTEGIEG